MTDERDLVEHTIEIDEYASAVLKIPKQLTAMDLKALMHKANKLFNLAEIPLVPKKISGKYVKLDDAGKKALVESYDKADDSEKQRIADSFGIGIKALYQKVWSIKSSGGVVIGSNNGSKKYSDKLVKRIITLLKTKTTTEVAEIVGMERKTMYDLVLKRTGKTPKEFRG